MRKPHSISVAGYTELPSPPLFLSSPFMVAKEENGGEEGGGGGEGVHRGDELSSESHATPRQQLEGLFKQVDDVSTNLKTSPVSTRDFSFITEEGVTIHDESTAYCLPPGGGSGTSGQGKNKMSEASRDIARYILSAKDLSATTDLARKAESNPSKIGCSAWTDRYNCCSISMLPLSVYPCYLYLLISLSLSISPISHFTLHAVLASRESAHESERDCLKTPRAVLLLRAAAVSTLIFNVWQEIHRG